MKLSNEETMKELNKEEQLKVFAMYWGCEYSHCHSAGNIDHINKEFFETYVDEDLDYILNDPKLHLTPLSEITDEHAVEVAEIVSDYWDKTLLTEKIFHGKRYAQRALFIPDGAAPDAPLQLTIHGIYIYQYLISHGYAVPLFFAPNHWANGKTALDLGIAISKNELK